MSFLKIAGPLKKALETFQGRYRKILVHFSGSFREFSTGFRWSRARFVGPRGIPGSFRVFPMGFRSITEVLSRASNGIRCVT